MTKAQWINHMEETTGLTRPSKGGSVALWKEANAQHKAIQCPECKKRYTTFLASARKRAREDEYRSCGLVKVIGSISGQVYWE